MDLYHMDASPPCRAVRMVARHLNLSLNLIHVNHMAGEHMTPQFQKINPQSVLPTLVDDGFVLWESRAVLTYMANRYVPHSPLYPTDPRSRASVERLLYFDMGTLFDACHKILYPVIFGGPQPDSEQEKPLVRALELLTGFLGDSKFLFGDDVTLADISILATLTVTEVSDHDIRRYKASGRCADYDLSRFPIILDYYERLKTSLPYYNEINDLGIQQMRGIRSQSNSK
nr:glutathione S-transferase 1-like [Rhipicephalus microplus]